MQARTGTEFARVFDFPFFGIDEAQAHDRAGGAVPVRAPGRPPIYDSLQLPRCSTLQARGVTPKPGENCAAHVVQPTGYLFDERDAINRRNFVSYGITTRLLARGPLGRPDARRRRAEEADKPADARRAPDDDDEDLLDDDESRRDIEGPEASILPAGLSRDTVPAFVGPPAPRRPGSAGRDAPAAGAGAGVGAARLRHLAPARPATAI